MSNEERGKRFCELYIRCAGLIGALYSAVPALVGFAILFATVPLRNVYLLRLVIALVFGGALGALVHRFGVALWLMKHRSPQGPATLLDGTLIGAAVGWGAALVPPLTSLLVSHHLESAKTLVIAAWLAATIMGALVGTVLTAVGRRHVSR